jgi:hypothetical protein
MLCGQPPFPGDAPGDVIARHQYFEPTPLHRARPDVPPGVDQLVMRLLEKRPADRHRTAADVVRAIDGLLAPAALGDLLPTLSTTTRATAATVSGKPPPAPRSRRLGILAAAAATAGLALLVLLLLRVAGVPGAGEPGALYDQLSGRGAAPWLAFEVDAPLRSLRSAAGALCRHGSLQGAFTRFLHLIASTQVMPHDDVVAPLESAVACFARRRRLPHAALSGEVATPSHTATTPCPGRSCDARSFTVAALSTGES